MRRPKGVRQGPAGSLFLLFFASFSGPLFGALFRGIWTPNWAPKSARKWSQNQFFCLFALGALFLASELPRDALWQSSGPPGAVLAGLKSEKVQAVLCENHFFESCLFGLSELHWAPLGSSRPLPGPSWGPDGPKSSQKRPQHLSKNESKNGSSFGLLLDPF